MRKYISGNILVFCNDRLTSRFMSLVPSDKLFRKNCLQNIFKNEKQLCFQDIFLPLELKSWGLILWLHWYLWSNFHWLEAGPRRWLPSFLDHPCGLGMLIRVTPRFCWLSQLSGFVSWVSGTHHRGWLPCTMGKNGSYTAHGSSPDVALL